MYGNIEVNEIGSQIRHSAFQRIRTAFVKIQDSPVGLPRITSCCTGKGFEGLDVALGGMMAVILCCARMEVGSK